ncbi:MAG: holo-ACP synthase [Burkholderiales bacterium]
MIYGIGTDILEVSRVSAILSRYGPRFARHVLTTDELPEYAATSFPERFLAKRFAAKEAFAKAIGTGLRGAVSLTNIRITHDALGKPGLDFKPALQALVKQRGIAHCHLSISDEKELVAAFVVLEQSA